MGFKITIGEAEIIRFDDGLFSYASIGAKLQKEDTAPAYGEPTDYTNCREPSYIAWENAMDFLGLHDFMFNDVNGLMSNHPGNRLLVPEHKQVIDNAYEAFYKKFPGCVPGIVAEGKPLTPIHAARIEWLKYWVDWALMNCKNPVFVNT